MGETTERIESMKKLILACVFFTLTGCATITDIAFPSKYDVNEYMLVNKVRTMAQFGTCDKFTVNMMYVTSLELKNYSQHLPRDKASYNMEQGLFTIVEELHKKENPSPVYCKAKLNIIEQSAERIQQVTGSKPR